MHAARQILIAVTLVMTTPAAMARHCRCNNDAKDKCKYKETAFLGVAFVQVSPELGAKLGLEKSVGLQVHHVAGDSPAAQAGIKKGDVLTKFGDQILMVPTQLRNLVHMRKPGDKVKITLYRNGKKTTATATLGKRKRMIRPHHRGHPVPEQLKMLSPKQGGAIPPEGFRKINWIFRSPRLSNEKKTELINKILDELSLPLKAVVEDQSLSIQAKEAKVIKPGTPEFEKALKMLPETTRQQIQKRLKEDGDDAVRLVQTPRGPLFISTKISQAPKDQKAPDDKK